MTFDLAAEIAEANADYFNEASAHDRAEEARKLQIALAMHREDARIAAGWERRYPTPYYGQAPALLQIIAAVDAAGRKL